MHRRTEAHGGLSREGHRHRVVSHVDLRMGASHPEPDEGDVRSTARMGVSICSTVVASDSPVTA